MRLVRLELKGFKSFANATTLHFGGADVVGVVGPNGSGKSNIVDAIRWVLGERKGGELRVDKMSSVIFNGTKARRPAGLAQAFLTFDNDEGRLRTDFAQVTIGRLLYRDGTSEYRLNGVTCRRKDVTALFRDTGVAGDSYAIIALGMVDDILADRDNSRLRMLEQAAGINTYKASKRETANRLARTREDLDRVDDLLHEIDGNLRDLERQARRARRYREAKQRYRELALDYAHAAGRALRASATALEGELRVATEEVRARAAEVEQLEAAVAAARAQSIAREQDVARERKALAAVVAGLREAVSERDLARQKAGYLESGAERWAAKAHALAEDRDRLSDEVDALRTAGLAAAAAAAEAMEAERDAHVRLASAQQRAAAHRRRAHARRQRAAEARETLRAADRRVATANARAGGLAEALQSQRDLGAGDQSRANEQQRLTRAARAKLAAAASALGDAEAARNAAVQLRDQRAASRDELRSELAERERELKSLTHERDLLTALASDLASSPEAERHLGEVVRWRGRHPQLIDVIEVDPAARAAVERVLAPVLASFVVDSVGEARAGLQALREAGLPTTSILVTPSPGAPLPEHSTLPGLTALRPHVRSAAEYARLLDVLLGDTYLNDDPLALATVPAGAVVVSPLGDALRLAASAKGPSDNALLGQQTARRERIAALGQKVSVVELERSRLVGALSSLEHELEGLAAAAGDTEGQVRTAAAVRNGAERALAAAEAGLSAAQTQAGERDTRISTLERDLAAARQEAHRAAAAQGPLAAACRAAENEVGEGDDPSSGASSLAEVTALASAAKLHALRLSHASEASERELAYATQRRGDTEEELSHGARQRESERAEAAALRTRLTELEGRIAEGTALREERQAALATLEREYLAQRDLDATQEDSLRHARAAQARATALAAELRERRSAVRAKLEALAERLAVEFDLDLDATLAEARVLTHDAPSLNAALTALRRNLEGFGEVNALAVEAFDAMQSRHEAMATQRADILEAAETLEGAIAELDREATAKLTRAFETVRGHFVEVFRHLFDAADTADLVMEDPGNPLESKIEIVARPRGKRPQTIAQLSGGEKTLTATAFLFALYLIKPAPFCIFDEVDAPLDDANVAKFNRIIKRFSADSQFVVVTHNKLTMAAVDTIYGVYMPELGVSAVTPVDFRDFEHRELAELVG